MSQEPRGRRGLAPVAPLQLLGFGHRFVGWATARGLTCPEGHHLRQDAWVLTDGAVRCKWQDPASRRECGRLLYLLACVPARQVEPDAPELYFVAEVSVEEVREFRTRRATTWQVLQALGVATRPAQTT